MGTSDRPVTVRLPEDHVNSMMGLCVIDNKTLADELRQAVAEYIFNRRSSSTFDAEVAEAKARQDRALDALVRDDVGAPEEATETESSKTAR